jgi:hypothetical protein
MQVSFSYFPIFWFLILGIKWSYFQDCKNIALPTAAVASISSLKIIVDLNSIA